MAIPIKIIEMIKGQIIGREQSEFIKDWNPTFFAICTVLLLITEDTLNRQLYI